MLIKVQSISSANKTVDQSLDGFKFGVGMKETLEQTVSLNLSLIEQTTTTYQLPQVTVQKLLQT